MFCEQLRMDAGVEEGHEEELVKMLLVVLQGQEVEVLEKELLAVLEEKKVAVLEEKKVEVLEMELLVARC